MTEAEPHTSVSPSEIVQVTTLDQFVQLLTHWHESKVKVLEHMLQIPEGTEVSLDEGPGQLLQGDFRQGFLVGLNLSLMELGILPFAVEQESADAAQPA